MAQVNETKSTADTLTVYKKLSVENDISATGAITQNGNQVISGITTASGANIGSVGTPSVTASTSNGTTTLTFDYLKGAKGDKGDTGATGATGPQGPTGATGATGSVASVSTTGSGNAVTSVTMDANKNVTATKGATFLTSHQTLPTALKNPNAIKFKNASGTEVSYDGSAAKDLTGGVYYATNAGTASSATSADSATKATQDGSGNNIVDTYVPQQKCLSDGVDLNTILTSGFYRLSAEPTNGPGGINYGQLIVSRAGYDTVAQLAFPYSSSMCYIRTASGVIYGTATWQDWRTVAFNDQFSYDSSTGTLTISI